MGMPKKKTKKAKKAAKAKARPSEAQPAPAEQAKPETPAEPKPRQKKAAMSCQYCGKQMKDARTLKIHERNCRPAPAAEPSPGPDKQDMESAILELKDQFRDQVDAMSKAMREREEQHEREFEEVRTVLRMEIDRHRKELERLGRAEKEAVHEPLPAPQPTESQPPATAEPEPASPRVPDGRPRAIDMLPLPAPTLPKKTFRPLPEEESIPDLEEPLPEPVEIEPPRPQGPSREELEALVREIVAGAQPQAPAQDGAGAARRLDALESKLERSLADLRRAVERLGQDDVQKRFEKDLARVSERVQDIMEDSGYGESLSVSKIPPTILEIVYQAILDDIHHEIIKTKGYQDAERIAREALEEVRLKTSGSELFKFDGRKIVTDSLARSIEANLISAKQIQTTYDVLLDKLLETVPHHKAKNFKGMIKVKSQEFAVDRATKLTKDFAKLEKIFESTNQMVAAMAANFNTRNLELHEMVESMKNTTLATKADREEIESLRAKVEDSLERVMNMATDIALIKAQLEMREGIRAAETTEQAEAPQAEGEILLAPGEMPAPEPGEAPPASPAGDIDLKVLECVGAGKGTKTAIVKESGLDPGAVAEALDRLVEARKLIAKKSGKRMTYTTLDIELERKLAAGGPPGQKPKKGRRAKPEPVSEPKHATESEGIPSEEKPAEQPLPEPEAEPAPQQEPKAPEPGPEEPEPAPTQEPAIEEPAAEQEMQIGEERTPVEKPEGPAEEKPEESRKPRKGKKAKKEKPRKGTAWVEEPKPEAIEEPPREQAPEPLPEPAPEPAPEPIPGAKSAEEPPKEAPAKSEKPKGKKPRHEKSEPPKEERAKPADDELPVIKKALEELSEDERTVLNVISADGMTLSGIQSKVSKSMKRFALLRALRVLIDSGHVGILTKGRMELYQKLTVEQLDTKNKERSKKEVK